MSKFNSTNNRFDRFFFTALTPLFFLEMLASSLNLSGCQVKAFCLSKGRSIKGTCATIVALWYFCCQIFTFCWYCKFHFLIQSNDCTFCALLGWSYICWLLWSAASLPSLPFPPNVIIMQIPSHSCISCWDSEAAEQTRTVNIALIIVHILWMYDYHIGWKNQPVPSVNSFPVGRYPSPYSTP